MTTKTPSQNAYHRTLSIKEGQQTIGKSPRGDRRSRRTTMALQQALVEMLLEKPLRDITILELTDKANISRTTFYLHYRNIDDLFEQMENSIYLQFEQIIQLGMAGGHSLLHVELDDKGSPSMPALKQVFQFIHDNPGLSVVLLNNPDSKFLDKIWSTGHDMLLERMASLQPDMSVHQIEYYYSFVINGIRGLIEQWIASDMQEPASQITEITTTFVLHNLGFLQWGIASDGTDKTDQRWKQV
ncbi:MAG: TetR/AcrR family transcriptional regulator [Clostridiaceae bacterium]|nr:TetR/AcrR family transcriptional regulator [Clostridiaceae bacterium]